MRTALFIVLLTSMSCKPTAPESFTSDAVVRGPAGSMDFTVTASGVMTLVPGVGEKLTKVDSVAATMTVVKEAVVPSTTPVAIGAINLGKVVYELDGSACSRDFLLEIKPMCTKSTEQASAQTASAAPAVTQIATPLADMVCGAHSGYKTKIWQKQFRVALTGADKELAGIKEVKYTVWHSYGKTFVGSSAANKFDSGSTFLTPVTAWNIDAATAVMTDGKEFPIPQAAISWIDDVPNKKAATPCE